MSSLFKPLVAAMTMGARATTGAVTAGTKAGAATAMPGGPLGALSGILGKKKKKALTPAGAAAAMTGAGVPGGTASVTPVPGTTPTY